LNLEQSTLIFPLLDSAAAFPLLSLLAKWPEVTLRLMVVMNDDKSEEICRDDQTSHGLKESAASWSHAIVDSSYDRWAIGRLSTSLLRYNDSLAISQVHPINQYEP